MIEHLITEWVATSPLNRLPSIDNGPIFDPPLFGIADGDDPLFAEYKHIIDDFHLMPREILREAASNTEQSIGQDISVICWVLPFDERIRRSNAQYTDWPPAPLWSLGTKRGEEFNHHIRRQAAQHLVDKGYVAVAPVHSPLWKKPNRYISTWSERHALYAAGLGTFSLTRGFITQRGMAMRCGTVIVNTHLTPTPRRYSSHTENCLACTNGTCGTCIDRCPAKAITMEHGHDKVQCREYRDEVFARLQAEQGLEAEPDGCGLCQTGVPCESRIPRVSN